MYYQIYDCSISVGAVMNGPWLILGEFKAYRPHRAYIVDTDSIDTPPPSNDENLDKTLQKIAAAFGMDLELLRAEAARLMHRD